MTHRTSACVLRAVIVPAHRDFLTLEGSTRLGYMRWHVPRIALIDSIDSGHLAWWRQLHVVQGTRRVLV